MARIDDLRARAKLSGAEARELAELEERQYDKPDELSPAERARLVAKRDRGEKLTAAEEASLKSKPVNPDGLASPDERDRLLAKRGRGESLTAEEQASLGEKPEAKLTPQQNLVAQLRLVTSDMQLRPEQAKRISEICDQLDNTFVEPPKDTRPKEY